jgi:hypothetical protein
MAQIRIYPNPWYPYPCEYEYGYRKCDPYTISVEIREVRGKIHGYQLYKLKLY